MHPIIYDVAVSLDGFIAGPGGAVEQFPHEGPIVEAYKSRLSGYATVLMGRTTYEFGYRYGLPPGANPYAPARGLVVSKSLDLPPDAQVERWVDLSGLADLRRSSEGPIYLCGGGVLAGALANLGEIDVLRVKRAPIMLSGGVPLFAGLERPMTLSLTQQVDYGDGLMFQEFAVG